jgi:hypothetical protein
LFEDFSSRQNPGSPPAPAGLILPDVFDKPGLGFFPFQGETDAILKIHQIFFDVFDIGCVHLSGFLQGWLPIGSPQGQALDPSWRKIKRFPGCSKPRDGEKVGAILPRDKWLPAPTEAGASSGYNDWPCRIIAPC